jgi:hypothetical protein
MITFRKLALALAATAALGSASLAVSATPAEAKKGFHKHFHHHLHGHWRWRGHYGFYGPAYAQFYGGCIVKRVVLTPWGYRVRRINVCY